MKVFVTRVIPQVGIDKMQEAGITITQWPEKRDLTQNELISYCQQHDALLSVGPNKLDATFLQQVQHLKVIALLSVGYDIIDIEAATKYGIPVGNTPGVLSAATADIAFLLMLATARKAFYQHKKIGSGNWGFYEPTANLGIELYGRTLGIFGLGKIGFELAKRCVGAYNMKIIYCNRTNNIDAEAAFNAVKVSFDELLQQSDVLSVHSALTPQTRGLFNKAAFSKMKPTSIFINTARGAIHNEEDLIEALQTGTIWGAGLDVTNPEPMHPNNILLTMPNVSVLPHIGSATVETRNAMAELAAANIIAGLNNKPLPYPVIH
jgi:glyoxylate reductase